MSNGKIKSALERALERAEKFNQVSEEELKLMEHKPQGHSLAGKYLNQDADLGAQLERVPVEIRPYVIKGIEETLLKNITLPENERAKQLCHKALEGLMFIKEDKEALNYLIGQLEHLFNYYLQALEQAKASVKAKLNQKYYAVQQQLEAQFGGAVKIDMESQPEFQQELKRVLVDLNRRFEGSLQQAKAKIQELK
ncbi:MAG: hypothetical protein H0Z40_09240 [Desulfotomaculum sp.]|nr:hypothetical protein [Desulfotomaculum sp.]